MTTKRTRVSHIKGILSLQKKRAKLASQLAALDRQLENQLESELAVASREAVEARSAAPRPAQVVSRKKASSTKKTTSASSTRGPKGVLREQILKILSEAGATGAAVRDIADQLGTKAANIHTWFSTNAQRVPGLKKIRAGHFALAGKATASTPAKAKSKTTAKPAKSAKPAKAAKTTKAAAPKAAKPVKAKASRSKSASSAKDFTPSRRGELKTSVISELKKAGSEGITVQDLAEKVGSRYKNLYIWFVTTGKRIPGIEKVAPARYRLKA